VPTDAGWTSRGERWDLAIPTATNEKVSE
jgi:hypothetical protein